MSAALMGNAIVPAAGVVLFTTGALMLFPIGRFAVVVSVPVIAAIVAGAKGYGNPRRLDARALAQRLLAIHGVLMVTLLGFACLLGAMLLVPHRESPTSRNRGRHVSIPPGAVDLGDGHSRYEPPGSSGLGWYFNNLTGVMRACGAGVTFCNFSFAST